MKIATDNVQTKASFLALFLNNNTNSRILLFIPENISPLLKSLIRSQLQKFIYQETFEITSLKKQRFDLILLINDQDSICPHKPNHLCNQLTIHLKNRGRLLYLCVGKNNIWKKLKSLFPLPKLNNIKNNYAHWNGYAITHNNLEISNIVKASHNHQIFQYNGTKQLNIGIIGPPPFAIDYTNRNFIEPNFELPIIEKWQDWQLVSSGTGAANNKSVFKTRSTTHDYYLKLAVDRASIWFVNNEYRNLSKLTHLCDSRLQATISVPVAHISKESDVSISIQKSKLIRATPKVSLGIISGWLSDIALAFKKILPNNIKCSSEVLNNHMINSPANDQSDHFQSLEKKLVIELAHWLDRDLWPEGFLTLTHGDFVPGNIICFNNKELLVIDWECANWQGVPGIDFLNYLVYSAIVNKKEPTRIIKQLIQSPSIKVKRAIFNYFTIIGAQRSDLGGLIFAWALHRLRVKESMKNQNFNPKPVYDVTEWILENKATINRQWNSKD